MGKSSSAQRATAAASSLRAAELSISSDDAFWEGIERMLADVAALARAEPLPDDFPSHVLTWLHEALATESEAFWQQGIDGQLRKRANREADAAAPDDAGRRELIESVIASGTARSAAPMPGGEPAGPGDLTWLACPIRSEGGTAAVLEVLHSGQRGPEQGLALEVLRSVAELCSDYLRRYQLHEFARERDEQEEFADFSRRSHESVDLRETAYAIVNEGRRWIGCDRVTVLAYHRTYCETLAVSGASRPDRRSNSIARLETLCAAVAAGGDPLAAGTNSTDLAPQVRVPLEAYLEAAQVRDALVLPLVRPAGGEGGESKDRAVVGVLVAEQFSGLLTDAQRAKGAQACEVCAPALDHAQMVRRIPWANLFRHRDWRSLVRRGRAALAVAGAAGALLLAACLVPADFDVEARGVLQPANRRDVFAPEDGVVEELFVNHGAEVKAGQTLVALRNAQLDLDLKRTWGELQAARKRLAAIETARVESAAVNSQSATAARLSGEDAELQELIAGLVRQHRLLEAQEAEMHVASPLAGRVLTWDLPQLLQGRPVHRGQALMTVADSNGEWNIELEVPDRDAGHVLEARQNRRGGALAATYRLATAPGTPHETAIDQVALSIERTASGEPALRVLGSVPPGMLAGARPGATVLAKIHCGRRSLAYVWLRNVYYAVATKLWF